jgi:hypothetical protein
MNNLRAVLADNKSAARSGGNSHECSHKPQLSVWRQAPDRHSKRPSGSEPPPFLESWDLGLKPKTTFCSILVGQSSSSSAARSRPVCESTATLLV